MNGRLFWIKLESLHTFRGVRTNLERFLVTAPVKATSMQYISLLYPLYLLGSAVGCMKISDYKWLMLVVHLTYRRKYVLDK